MGCITKHYLNKETVIGVWKIEEDLETLLGLSLIHISEPTRPY
jgi:hypothetical protein